MADWLDLRHRGRRARDVQGQLLICVLVLSTMADARAGHELVGNWRLEMSCREVALIAVRT